MFCPRFCMLCLVDSHTIAGVQKGLQICKCENDVESSHDVDALCRSFARRKHHCFPWGTDAYWCWCRSKSKKLLQEGAWKPVARPGKNMYDAPRVWSPFSSAPWRMPFTKQGPCLWWDSNKTLASCMLKDTKLVCEASVPHLRKTFKDGCALSESRASCRDFKTPQELAPWPQCCL